MPVKTMSNRTTIALSKETRDDLWALKNNSKETYDEVLQRLIQTQ